MIPSHAIPIWYDEETETLNVSGRDGRPLAFPLAEPGRLTAYLRQVAEHVAFRRDANAERLRNWELAVERKRKEDRERADAKREAEAKRLARRAEAKDHQRNRAERKRAAIDLLEELGL